MTGRSRKGKKNWIGPRGGGGGGGDECPYYQKRGEDSVIGVPRGRGGEMGGKKRGGGKGRPSIIISQGREKKRGGKRKSDPLSITTCKKKG